MRTAAISGAGPQAQPIFQPVNEKVLPGRRDGDGALGHAGQRRQRDVLVAVEDEVLVDLVGDREHVVLDAQLGRSSRAPPG